MLKPTPMLPAPAIAEVPPADVLSALECVAANVPALIVVAARSVMTMPYFRPK